ncbi:MAG: hypothetical protein ACK48P_05160 [Holosporales bacterium]|jgi:hypothetical protein
MRTTTPALRWTALMLFLMLGSSPGWGQSPSAVERSLQIQAQNQASQGVWLRDNISNCAIWVPSFATRVDVSGKCVNDRVEGQASITLYNDVYYRAAYDGYFLAGYYVAPQKIEGSVGEAPTGLGTMFEFRTGMSGLRLYTKLVPRTNQRSSACNSTVYAAINPQQVILSPEITKKIGEVALGKFQELCSSFGYDGSFPKITIAFVPLGFFNSPTPTILASVEALWSEDRWRLADLKASKGNAPATTQEASSRPNISLTLSAFITSNTSLGYPVCQANFRLANVGSGIITGITIIGNVATTQRQVVTSIRSSRETSLPVNAQTTIRSNLPAAACPFIGFIQITQVACQNGENLITDCKPFIRVLRDDPATTTAGGLPGVQVLF